MSWIVGILGALGSVASGFFSLKKEQVAADIAETAARASVANTGIKTQPAIIEAENGPNSSFLGRNWRPLACLIFTLLIACRFTGILGPKMPLDLEEVYVSGMVAVMGAYVFARSWDKRG